MNDDFAKDVSEKETLAELRTDLEEKFQKEAEQKTKENKQEALLKELLKHVEIDLPETMIEREVDNMLTQTAMRLAQQGLDVKRFFTADVIPQLRQRSRDEAIERLKRTLALEEISKRESIQVTDEEVASKVKELTEQLSGQDYDPDRLQEYVKDELLTEKTINWLLEHATVELVPEGSLSAKEESPAPTAESEEQITTDAEEIAQEATPPTEEAE